MCCPNSEEEFIKSITETDAGSGECNDSEANVRQLGDSAVE